VAGPLDGIRVLDLTTMVSGPIATMMLADQGAEVIKIESPAGDIMRRTGTRHRGMSASFLSCNRSKRSLCVDLKTASGLDIVKRLAATADVLVQNFRPGAIERMGLGEDVVRALRPDIVFVSISGFGEAGPYAHQRVYDGVIQALSGLAEIQADRDTGRPRMVRTIVPDKTTAITAAQAITAALFARERTGRGQHVRLAMLDTMIAFLWPEASSSLSFVGHERDPGRIQQAADLVFATRDGYITAGAVSDAEWGGLCRAFGRDELIDDVRFATAAARVDNVVERREIMNVEIAKWPSAEILARLDREGVPSAPILGRAEVIDDAQVRQNGIIEEHDDPVLGRIRQPRPAARFAATPSAIRSMAPGLGADNDAILSQLG
jgi:crotonobetainyl-CoA:carnitine CoA-transferase CaiB-like acyl-CoA transferase